MHMHIIFHAFIVFVQYSFMSPTQGAPKVHSYHCCQVVVCFLLGYHNG